VYAWGTKPGIDPGDSGAKEGSDAKKQYRYVPYWRPIDAMILVFTMVKTAASGV
jgi:hypothetical protein